MKLKTIIQRVIFHEGPVFYLGLVVDRFLFKMFFQHYYGKTFRHYGRNIKWGIHGMKYCIPRSVRISSPHLISIADNCQFDEYVYLQCHHEGEGLFVGNNTRVNAFSHIQAFSKITIGNNVLIAPFSHISGGNHGNVNDDRPKMEHPYFKAGEINIGDGVWLGRSSHVLGGVSLGRNCIVAAGAVVTKSFPEFSVIGGIPARTLRRKDDHRT